MASYTHFPHSTTGVKFIKVIYLSVEDYNISWKGKYIALIGVSEYLMPRKLVIPINRAPWHRVVRQA